MERKTTRARFLQETLRLFYEKGYKATTMRDIARALNIEAATIYNYVDSKQALLDGFLFEIANKFLSGITDIEASSYSPVDKIKALVRLNVRLTTEHPHKVGLLVGEWKHLEEVRQAEFLENRQQYESKFSGIIKAGIAAGEIRDMDEEVAMHAILSSIRWLFSWYTPEKQALNPIELEKQLVDFILRGIQAT